MTEPLDPELDLLVSADLDGDLEGLAAELGVESSELRRRLATPAALARRDALAGARGALGAPVAPLDDVTRRRLLAPARGTTPTRRSRVAPIAAAAAVLALVVVGAGVLVSRGNSGSDSSTAARSAASSAGSTPSGDLGDLGSLDQAAVDDLLGGSGSQREQSAARSGAADAPEAADSAADAGLTPAPVAPADLARCVDQYAKQGTIRFRAGGVFAGQPAVILGIADASSDRTIVLVVAADNCDLVLYSASR